MTQNRRVSSDPAASYLRAWLANPLRFGAVAPSGPALAALITSEIRPDRGPILELGPGKGVFTHALLRRGVAEADLVLVEQRADFVRVLRQQFPAAYVEAMDAARLDRLAHLFEGRPAGAAISGLPLLSMPVDTIKAILEGVFALLGPGGALYQFTYAPRCPVSHELLGRLGLTAERIGGALLNLPPASVYRISR